MDMCIYIYIHTRLYIDMHMYKPKMLRYICTYSNECMYGMCVTCVMYVMYVVNAMHVVHVIHVSYRYVRTYVRRYVCMYVCRHVFM